MVQWAKARPTKYWHSDVTGVDVDNANLYPESVSFRLRERIVDSRLRLEPDVSLFSVDSISVRPANRAHKSFNVRGLSQSLS